MHTTTPQQPTDEGLTIEALDALATLYGEHARSLDVLAAAAREMQRDCRLRAKCLRRTPAPEWVEVPAAELRMGDFMMYPGSYAAWEKVDHIGRLTSGVMEVGTDYTIGYFDIPGTELVRVRVPRPADTTEADIIAEAGMVDA